MFYKDKLFESIDGRQGFSKSFLADYILYELIKVDKKTYRKKKSLELKVGLLISHNFKESYCTDHFDYFIVNSDSKLHSFINKEQALYNQEHRLRLETARLLLNQNVYNTEEYEIDQKEKELDEIQNSWRKFTPCGLYKLWVNGRF